MKQPIKKNKVNLIPGTVPSTTSLRDVRQTIANRQIPNTRGTTCWASRLIHAEASQIREP